MNRYTIFLISIAYSTFSPCYAAGRANNKAQLMARLQKKLDSKKTSPTPKTPHIPTITRQERKGLEHKITPLLTNTRGPLPEFLHVDGKSIRVKVIDFNPDNIDSIGAATSTIYDEVPNNNEAIHAASRLINLASRIVSSSASSSSISSVAPELPSPDKLRDQSILTAIPHTEN